LSMNIVSWAMNLDEPFLRKSRAYIRYKALVTGTRFITIHCPARIVH
jgi:hypothetical protein